MTSIRRNIKLYDAVVAGTGNWIPLDVRYEQEPTSRPLRIVLTSGDTLELQAIVKDSIGIDKSFLTSLLAEDISSIKTFTASETYLLSGNWTYIRFIKVGTAGKGIAEGYI